MGTTIIAKRFRAPNSIINCIGSGFVQINTPIINGVYSIKNTMKGILIKNGILSIGSTSDFDIIDIELGIPSSDNLHIIENTTYNDSNIINNLTVDGCVFTISEISDLTVVGTVSILNGGSIVGTYSTTPITNGDLEVLGEINLYN